MSETILKLNQIGQNIVVGEYPWEQQAWRWCFETGFAENSDGNPVFNYAANFTLYSFPDLRQLTMFLVYGTEPGDSPFLANIILQGVSSPGGVGRGSISAASKDYVKTIGATFEIKNIGERTPKWELTIDKDIFEDNAALTLSETQISGFRYRASEAIPQRRGNRWPPF